MTALELIAAKRVLIAAHRGNSTAAPENTLPAFDSAVRLGVDLVELDYRHSADGVPMVFHDDELNRRTDACQRWNVETTRLDQKTAAELRDLDAGGWYDAAFAGTRIPTLEEALDAIRLGSTPLLERKAGDAGTLVELLRRKAMVNQVVVQAFDWQFLADCRRLEPSLALAALGDREWSAAKFDQIERLGVQAVCWDNRTLTPDLISIVHERGWKAWVWTVDSLERASELVAAGIDAIITNVPERMQRLLTGPSRA